MEKVSRTQKKKAAENLQKVGERLAGLEDAQLEALDLPGELKQAVWELRRFKSHGARKRQLQYIGRLMRNYDTGIVQEALLQTDARQSEKRRQFKRLEHWRDELLAGDNRRVEWLVENYPGIDRDRLAFLVNCARGISTQMNAREAARKLFRFLSQLQDPQ